MKTHLQTAVDYAAYVALRVLIAVLQAMPLSACDRAAKGLAWLVGERLGFRRQVVDENLRTAFPEWTDAQRAACARRMWRHLFLMVAEIAHTQRKMHRTNWRQRYFLPQVEEMLGALLLDRPKVIISGHYGNFELGGYLLGMFGFATHTVARPLDNRFVDRFVNDFRSRTGQFMLPKKGSAEAAERLLRSGGALALLGDQAAGSKACWVEFFGRPASTHKAVSLFSLTFEAPTIVMAARRAGGPLRYEGLMAAVIDPQDEAFEYGTTTAMTEWFTAQLEQLIRQAPEQYWWVHRRWKGQPPAAFLRRMSKKRARESTAAEATVMD